MREWAVERWVMPTLDARPRDRALRQVIIDIAVLIAIGVVLGVLAPLGTGYMGLAGRIVYWVVMALVGYLLYKPIGTLVIRLEPKLELPNWFLWSASVAIATVPMAVVVWVVSAGGKDIPIPSLETALVHYLMVLVVGSVVTLLMNLLPVNGGAAQPVLPNSRSDEARQVLQSAAETPALHSRFLDRLPPELGSELIALEMEDHYVRAHTSLGSGLVLLRLRDALAELDGLEGMQVHRSWWVARHAVSDVKRDGRNVRLVLDTGVEAPVSRANVAVLRDAGWI